MKEIRHPMIMAIASLERGGREREREFITTIILCHSTHTRYTYLCLCYLVVMVRELEVHPSSVDVSTLTKNVTEKKYVCVQNSNNYCYTMETNLCVRYIYVN